MVRTPSPGERATALVQGAMFVKEEKQGYKGSG